jgi:hypothetical protein
MPGYGNVFTRAVTGRTGGRKMTARHWLAIVALIALFAGGFASAHHSHASLDRDDVRRMSGVVTRYLWRSPHVYIQVNVLRDDGSIAEYTMEMNNPMSMSRAGWNKDTWQVGDRIVWEGAHDRDKDRTYMGLTWAEREDGSRLYINSRDQKAYLEEAGKEIPDYLSDDVKIKPAASIGEGFWSRIAEDGGRFKNIYTPQPAVDNNWPFTEYALQRIAAFDEGDNPINKCIFNGPPRATFSLPKFQWQRIDEQTITVDRDLWPRKRIIHLDENAAREEANTFGHSIGWFEGDDLHVRTDDFVPEEWAIFWGVDSSDQLELYERYWLSDGGMRMNVEMTITDPVMLTEPFTVTHQWKKIADSTITHAECSVENANFFLTAGYN